MKRKYFGKSPRDIAYILSIGVYLLSLTQKCYCTTASCGDSLAVLFSGIIGVFLGGAGLTWLANPVLFASWFYHKRAPLGSLICSVVAVLIMISFLFFKRIVADEAGTYKNIVAYKAGYWLWLSSAIIMAICNAISYFSTAKTAGLDGLPATARAF